MPLLVDTYNVLHVTGVLPPDLAGIDTASLIELLSRSRWRREQTTLVCDGLPGESAPRGRFGPVSVRYAGPNRLADDVILDLIARSSVPRRLTVVSSDREIVRAARRRRCRILNSRQFLDLLGRDATASTDVAGNGPVSRPTGPLSDEEIGRWTAEFDVDEEAIEAALPAWTRSRPPDNQSTSPPTRANRDEPGPAGKPDEGPTLPDELLEEAERMLESEDRLSPDDTDPDRMDG